MHIVTKAWVECQLLVYSALWGIPNTLASLSLVIHDNHARGSIALVG